MRRLLPIRHMCEEVDRQLHSSERTPDHDEGVIGQGLGRQRINRQVLGQHELTYSTVSIRDELSPTDKMQYSTCR